MLSTRPKKGDIVSLSSDSQSRRDAPVNPVILRIRDDLQWDDVINNYEGEIAGITIITKNHTTTLKLSD